MKKLKEEGKEQESHHHYVYLINIRHVLAILCVDLEIMSCRKAIRPIDYNYIKA